MPRFAAGLAGRPSVVFLGSFAGLIALGAVLLSLPASTVAGGLSPVEALFMATSAVCVTGLSILNVGTELTPFGQWVLLGLIQLGALGLMTFYAFVFMLMGQSVPFLHRTVLRETLGAGSGRENHPVRLLRSVVGFTALLEGLGTAALYVLFRREEPPAAALKKAVFHAVSAFCNAGFSLQEDSFVRWRSDPAMNLVLIALIVLGGLGFIALTDLWGYLMKRIRRRTPWGRVPAGEAPPPRPVLSLHTRIVLAMTGGLVLLGALIFWFLLPAGGDGAGARTLEAVFLSVTARTAGFNTIPTEGLGDAVLLVVMALMFVGASPGSTGGGVKTTTFFVLVNAFWSRYRGYESSSAFGRSIPEDLVRRAGSIVLIGVGTLSAFLFAILAAEGGAGAASGRFLPLLFEAVSAFGTVGLSMGATGDLSPPSLIFLVVLMYIGRIGPLTLFVAMSEPPHRRPRYPDEVVLVG